MSLNHTLTSMMCSLRSGSLFLGSRRSLSSKSTISSESLSSRSSGVTLSSFLYSQIQKDMQLCTSLVTVPLTHRDIVHYPLTTICCNENKMFEVYDFVHLANNHITQLYPTMMSLDNHTCSKNYIVWVQNIQQYSYIFLPS